MGREPAVPVTSPNSAPMSAGSPDARNARWVRMKVAARVNAAPSARIHTPRTRTRSPFCLDNSSRSESVSVIASGPSPRARRHSNSRISRTGIPVRREVAMTGEVTLRGYDRVLRVAWTVADSRGRTAPGPDEVTTAMFLRSTAVAA